MYRGDARTRGFTTVELIVVVLVIAALTALIYPRIETLIVDAKFADIIQDAADIGASVEILKLEGEYDPGDASFAEKIAGMGGRELNGWISEIHDDGCFTYNRDVNGVTYVVRYDSASGSVFEVYPIHAH